MAEETQELAIFSRMTATRLLQANLNTSEGALPSDINQSSQTDGWMLAYTTAGVTARSGTTTGTGSAALKYIDDSGVIQDLGISVTVRNWSAKAVGTNRYIWVNRSGPLYIVVNVECPE